MTKELYRFFRASLALVFIYLAANPYESARASTPTFVITPSSVSNTYTGTITLNINGLNAGDTVVVQKFLDLNSNGVIDSSDFLVQQFQLTDGQGPPVIASITNINVPGDLNAASGAITAQLSPIGEGFEQLVVGQFLFKLSSPSNGFTPITNLFVVTNFPFAQSFGGTVVSNGTATVVPYAMVLLSAPGNDFNPQAATVANASGNYTLKAAPGTYRLSAIKTNNFVTDIGNAPVLTLGSNATITTNLSLLSASQSISGRLVDATNASLPLPGILMVTVSSNGGVFGFGSANSNGNFSLPVNSSGQFGVSEESQGFDLHGYANFHNGTNANAGANNVTIAFPKATALIYGTVKDGSNNPIVGLRLEGDNGNSGNGLYEGDGTTFPNGSYVVGVVASNWSVSVDQGSSGTQFANYIFTQGPSWTYNNSGNGTNITAGTAVQANFTGVPATSTISGYLKDSNGNPISGIGVNGSTTINGTNFNVGSVDTASNGYYSLPAVNGTWSVSVNCCSSCDNALNPSTYDCPDNQVVNVSGSNTIANFVAPLAGLYLLSGNVLNYSSDPIANVGVEASGNGNNLFTTTDINGYYQFSVANGDWTVSLNCTNLIALGYSCVSGEDAFVSDTNSDGNDFFVSPPALQIISPLPNGTVGIPYSEQLQATGGLPPFNWYMQSGQLPDGLNLDTNGLIYGTPTSSGSFDFYVGVSDSISDYATEEYNLVINSTPAGDFEFYFVSKGRFYLQTNSSSVIQSPVNPFGAVFGIYQTATGTVLNANTIPPGGMAVPFPSGTTGQLLQVSNTFSSQSALDAAFPAGEYAFVINGLNDGLQLLSLDFPSASNYPGAPQISNLAAAQSIIASNAFTFQWQSDTGGPGDSVWFYLTSPNGSEVFSSTYPPYGPGALTGLSTSELVPASTLQAGSAYQGYLLFIRAVNTNGDGFSDLVSATTFPVTTTGVVHPQIRVVSYSMSGGVTLSLTGTPSQSYAIQASTNLVTWTNLIVTNLPMSTIQFTDHQASGLSRRFYRAQFE